jgi:hypothetical protein
MQPAKKNLRVLSAISMAAAATLAAKASAVTITPFYGNQSSGVNAIYEANNVSGTGTLTYENVTGSAPTTISLPVGDYLFMAVDLVVTNNANPEAGLVTSSNNNVPQPSNLGLAVVGMQVNSTDTNATTLAPILGAIFSPAQTIAGLKDHNSTAVINTTLANNSGGGLAPSWSGTALTSSGDTLGNGNRNTPASYGIVGSHLGIFGGVAAVDASTPAGVQTLQNFAGASPTYANATPFFTQLSYEGVAYGTVTLSPFINPLSTAYWVLRAPATSSSASVYSAVAVGSGDTVGTLPALVIKVDGGPGFLPHAIVSLTSGSAPPPNYGSQVGSTLALSGGHGTYVLAQTGTFTAIATGSAVVGGTGWNPTSDKETFGVEVLDGGIAPTSGELAALVRAINNGDANVPASGVSASTVSPPPDLFGTQYNLFLTFTGSQLPGTQFDTLGLDLSSTNDPLLSGYTFSEVAVVPEPMSLSLLMLGGVGLMARRNRRKA